MRLSERSFMKNMPLFKFVYLSNSNTSSCADCAFWKPFKGEVVDAVVSSVNSMGFFADVGPLSVFISKHLIPNDMKYTPSHTPPAYISEDQVVMKSSKVRIKIIGTRSDVNSISAIGSIKEDYLGPL